ncbi:ABC transporter permease [Candidatus Acetothermia bacterium]|nr:ABC transporter permease [Candidatus Acetothermia bacterium]
MAKKSELPLTKVQQPSANSLSPSETLSTDGKSLDLPQVEPYRPRRELRDLLPWLPGFLKVGRRFLTNPLSVTGLTLIAFFAFVAIAAPWLAPPPPGSNDNLEIPQDFNFTVAFPQPPNDAAWQIFPPDWNLHPLGTTGNNQYDLYYGVVWGTRTAFTVGLVVIGVSLLIGLFIGSIAGFLGGLIDEVLMRIVDIFLIFPFLVAAVVLTVVLSSFPYIPIFGYHLVLHGVWVVVLAIALVNWTTYARLVRGDLLSAKEKEYVQAARAVGASGTRIIVRHLLPNTIYPVLVYASLDFGSQVLTVAALSFLGLGAPLGYADWGQLINNAQSWIIHGGGTQYWYVLVVPAVAISLFILGFNLIGDAVRDIFDPHLRGRGAR